MERRRTEGVPHTGLTPDGDVLAEAMGEVVTNTTSKLTPADLAALIAYLRTLPPLPGRAQVAQRRPQFGKRARRPEAAGLDQEARPQNYCRGEKAGAAERGPDTGVARSATR